jgi:LPXTG-motif cell wall-anchored protein
MSRRRSSLALLALLALVLAGAPVRALAHGDEEETAGGEAEVKALSAQPARILAQQAIAELKVRGDKDEAAMRLDAALESKDQNDIDVRLLRAGTEKLDGGDPEGAVPLLDEALSRPLGAKSGKALHEAGREFEPATGAQEVVGIVAGALLLALGLVGIAAGRRRRPRAAGP